MSKDKIVYPKGFSRWSLVAPPASDSVKARKANYSNYEWVVSRRDDAVVITKSVSDNPPQPELPFTIGRPEGAAALYFGGSRHIIKVADGYLVGFNKGEWGGALWWFSPQGKKRYMISNDQVVGYMRTKAGIFAIEGLAHMTISEGKIIRLRKVGIRWTSERFVDLGSAPYAATQDADGSLLVVTSEQLLRVQTDKKITVLLAKSSWDGTYPNSLVRSPSGNLYLGMRYAVARISPVKGRYQVNWLVTNKLL